MNLIIKILKFIDSAMDSEIFPDEMFKAKNFGVSEERFAKTVCSLVDGGYIAGISIKYSIGIGCVANYSNVRLTVSGIEFLENKKQI